MFCHFSLSFLLAVMHIFYFHLNASNDPSNCLKNTFAQKLSCVYATLCVAYRLSYEKASLVTKSYSLSLKTVFCLIFKRHLIRREKPARSGALLLPATEKG